MLTRLFAALATLLLPTTLFAQPVTEAAAVANEAVAEALKLPLGYKRDVVLRSVSRNLREFSQRDAGVRAARAMTDSGMSELHLGTPPVLPRYIPMREALPSGSPCDVGLWRRKDSRLAETPAERERWARECLLARDFHWIGLPAGEQVRGAAVGLPTGVTKVEVLAMLIRYYRDAETLRFAATEFERDRPRLPAEARDRLAAMLAAPFVLYRLGRKEEALAIARNARTFEAKAEVIRALIGEKDTKSALIVFETLSATPPEFAEGCYSWFDSIGGLGLDVLGNAKNPTPALGEFLDRLPASPIFARICPKGLDAEIEAEHLIAAGRFQAAVAAARREPRLPFILVRSALAAAYGSMYSGNREAARAYAMQAAAALPPFDPGDPVVLNNANHVVDANATIGNYRNPGEMGRTRHRFEAVRLLAASGAVAEADELARAQPAGALRAVALSAAIAGRAGLRFDDQAPMLGTLDADEV